MDPPDTALSDPGNLHSLVYYPALNAFSILSFNENIDRNEHFIGCDLTTYLNDLKNWCFI